GDFRSGRNDAATKKGIGLPRCDWRRYKLETRRVTVAQALVSFLKNQYVERDGRQHPFFAGMLGIFGHGNVSCIGQALQQNPDFPYILVRNEQSGVHLAAGYAKASNRLRTFACTSSIGPGATNMITGAALATIKIGKASGRGRVELARRDGR